LRYCVTISGLEHFPGKGGVLLLCNHVSYVDTVILSMACPRAIRFLSFEGLFSVPILGTILRICGAIPVSPTRATDAIRRAAECLRQGEVICIFPEGQLTRTGNLMELKSGFEIIARQSKCPVVVARLDGLWGSVFSFEGGRYFTKWPKGFRRQTGVSLSAPLYGSEATTERVRDHLLNLAAGGSLTEDQPV
jgi:acyl-[acyl-carrier-protein]-phospholipid O-acyltransferase/long-chain-fatty-acid--[acyl-carrier-protein] ligase